MTVLSHIEVLRIEGADAAEFLHAQLTVSILGLAVKQSAVACYCEPKGRVLCMLVVVHAAENEFYLLVERSLAEAIRRRLQMFVLRSAVSIENQTDLVVCNGLLDTGVIADLTLPWLDTPQVHIVKTCDVADQESQEQVLLQEIRHGFSWLNASTSGVFLPQMLAVERWQALDFTKGCYPGQEIVARTHYLGRIKRKLALYRGPSSDELPRQNLLSEADGKIAADIVNSVLTDDFCWTLAVVKHNYADLDLLDDNGKLLILMNKFDGD